MEFAIGSIKDKKNVDNNVSNIEHKSIKPYFIFDSSKTRVEISRMATFPDSFLYSAEDYFNFIKNFDNDKIEQARVIAFMINEASRGFGTTDDAFRSAIYSIDEITYPLVEQILSENYERTSIKGYINEECNETEAKDLIRHIGQFKKNN